MAEVHQERRAVLLRRDRIFGSRRQHLERLAAELPAPRRALLLAHRPGYADGRFLSHVFDRLPRLFADILPEDDALQIAAAVADDRKLEPSRAALVVAQAL